MMSTQPSLTELMEFLFLGLSVVLVTLSLLAICCAVMGWIVVRIESWQTEKDYFSDDIQQTIKSGSSHSMDFIDGDENLISVIAAAVSVVIDQPHRVVKVQSLTDRNWSWTHQGRNQHHSSHKTR